MLRVALTGNAGAGKSTVARLWRERGVPVLEADELAREAVAPGTDGLRAVVETFGTGFLQSDGTLDRGALRRLVFGEAEKRKALEAILHPRIRALRDRRMAELEAARHPLVVAEIPLLFELGMEGEFDVVILVDAPEEVRLRRLVEDRGLDPEEARRILAAQDAPDEKRRKATFVLENSGTLEELKAKALQVLELVRSRAGVGGAGPAADAGEVGLSSGPRAALRMDLHVHTRASWDSLSDPEALLHRARERGIGRLAVTDHNVLGLALELYGRYPEVVIPGEEVRTREGVDVIGLYLVEEIPRGIPAREVCHRIREQGGVVYLPHPFAPGKGGAGRLARELAPLVDVVEVFNARLHPARHNLPARTLAQEFGRLAAGGSDAHSVGEVGGGWVEVPPHPNTPTALLEALRAGAVGGRTAPLWVHGFSLWAKVWKRVKPRRVRLTPPEGRV